MPRTHNTIRRTNTTRQAGNTENASDVFAPTFPAVLLMALPDWEHARCKAGPRAPRATRAGAVPAWLAPSGACCCEEWTNLGAAPARAAVSLGPQPFVRSQGRPLAGAAPHPGPRPGSTSTRRPYTPCGRAATAAPARLQMHCRPSFTPLNVHVPAHPACLIPDRTTASWASCCLEGGRCAWAKAA